ncbi:hypothetical protein A2U01_0116237, partial [Trifolium medium]|nr:hypothetical protein [Trifolium medium]
MDSEDIKFRKPQVLRTSCFE